MNKYGNQEIHNFFNECEEQIKSKFNRPTTPIYHYTNFDGLQGILSSQQFWLTDHAYLNDPSEIHHGKKIIEKIINDQLSSNNALQDYLKSLINQIINKSYKVYITSFCEDGDYLPAWRYYAENGAGYSIGFKPGLFQPTENPSNSDSIEIFKITYDNHTLQIFNDIFEIANKRFPDWKTETNLDSDEIHRFLVRLLSCLFILIPSVKNEDYRDEKEWRLCMPQLYHQETNTWYPGIPTDRLIITHNNMSQHPPFLNLKDFKSSIPRIKSNKFNFSDIDTIYIGPRLDFLTAKLAIEKILLTANIDRDVLQSIRILRSEKPFR